MRALYRHWPEGARRSYGWATPLIVLMGYAVSSVPLFLAAVIYTFYEVSQGTTPEAAGAAFGSTPKILIPSILVQFLVWGWFTRVWVRHFERRGPASLGLTGWSALPRYIFGAIIGLGLVTGLGFVSSVLTGISGGQTSPIDLESVVLPGSMVLLALGGVAFVFLIQGAVEEYIFRGWLMSVLVARWGLWAGVIVSTLIFGLFHIHVFVSGFEFGLVAIAGLTMTGLVLALICVWTGKIYEAMAAHGVFNAVAIIAPSLVQLSQNPQADLSSVLADIFANATGTAGVEATTLSAASFAQAAFMGAIAFVLIWIVRAARRQSEPNQQASPDGHDLVRAGV